MNAASNAAATTPTTPTTPTTLPPRDREANFHGNRLLFILWERHLVICAPIALALPPTTTFGDLLDRVLPGTVFAQHPDWALIDWAQARWSAGSQPLQPEHHQTLAELGLGHKALLRLRTPGLDGIGGVGG
jgi:phenol hydroxylase P4 protein